MRLAGTVMMKETGRPQHVFCNTWKPPPDKLVHECYLTDWCLLYEGATFVRGYKVNKDFKADAEMEMAGSKYYVEMHTGEMSSKRAAERMVGRYRDINDFLLIVTLTVGQMEGLLKRLDDLSRRTTPDGACWR